MKYILIISILLIYGLVLQNTFIFWFAVVLIAVFYKEIKEYLKKDIESYE
jgi:hypothetical protein